MNNINVFRTAVLVYSETEGIKKKVTVIKKVIESTFVNENNILMSAEELIDSVKKINNLTVFREEVVEILDNPKNSKHFDKQVEKGMLKYRLSDKRYKRLLDIGSKNISEFIEMFVSENGLSVDIKEKIYLFLYNLFQNGIEEFQAILEGKSISSSNASNEFEPKDIQHISDFLQWDNKEKNSALMALSGYSLEYAMLTSNSSNLYGTRLGSIFSNKKLYIDTNIIYYCIGINGEEYKKSNESLLDKCLLCKEELYITKVTEQEFNNTLEHYINEIKNYESPSISNIRYRIYMNNKDIYLYYLEWKKSRRRFNTVAYFKKHIQDEYKKWLRKYNVKIDSKIPYDENNDRSIIEQYSQEIPYKGVVNYDALNILWLEKKRSAERDCFDFFDTSYFLLSPHRSLKKWDMERKNNIPVIISPDLWMILLNRFISRSDDDYKSFISFINIKAPTDEVINNKEFFMIVQAIEEVTNDLEQQESIIDVLVEENFSYLNKGESEKLEPEVIYQKTIDKAENLLETRIKTLEKKVDELQETANMSIKASKNSNEKVGIIQEKYNESQKEKEILIDNYIREKLRNKKIIHVGIILIVTSLLLWQLIDIFVRKNVNNVSITSIQQLVANTPLEGSFVEIFMSFTAVAITGVIGTIDYKLLKIFYNKKTVDEFKERKREAFLEKKGN